MFTADPILLVINFVWLVIGGAIGAFNVTIVKSHWKSVGLFLLEVISFIGLLVLSCPSKADGDAINALIVGLCAFTLMYYMMTFVHICFYRSFKA